MARDFSQRWITLITLLGSGGLVVLLLRLVASTARSGLPPALSPTGQWNPDGALEAAHGWIEARLK